MMRVLIQLLGIVLSIVAIVLVVNAIDVQETGEVLGQAAAPPLILALGALTLQIGILAARWRTLLPVATTGSPVRYRTVVEALLVGILANSTLPARLGEVVRTVFVARRGAVDTAGSAGTVVLERVLDITVLAAVAVIAAVTVDAPRLLSQTLGLMAIGGLVVIGLLISGVVPRILGWLAARAPARAMERPRVNGAIGWAARLVEGVHAGRRPAVVVRALGATVASVMLDGVIFWSVGQSLGIPLDWAQSLLLATAAVLVTGIPSGPASIGTFELAVSFVAVGLGIAAEAGLALALLAHAIIVIPPSATGVLVLLLAMRRPVDP